MPRIHFNRLRLTDFRNWAQLDLRTDRRHVVLVGENGAGKTNILEAVSFFSPGRGLRRAPYASVARRGGSSVWSVHGELQAASGPVSIGTGLRAVIDGSESQRHIRIDGVAASGEDLLQYARIGWLVPAMDGLFTGAAAERRKFLDRLVLAIEPSHGKAVSGYEKSMRARNRLLTELAPDPAWLDAIERQMAEQGAAMTLARLEMLGLLSERIGGSTHFPTARVAMECETAAWSDRPAAEMEDLLADRLRAGRRADASAGRTLFGPHRAELTVLHAAKNMPAGQCSTGEQKALLVGIVLSHAQLVRDLTGTAPVLLLDEIAAHLDALRRTALFDMIEALDCQAWMTGTDRALFEAIGERALLFQVAGDRITRE